MTRRIVIGQGVVDWVADHQHRPGGAYGPSLGIGMEKDGALIAGVVYNEYNKVNINMHVASIGANWMTREYLFACFDYPFNKAKVKRVSAFIEEDNEAAIRFDTHLGFKYETRLKDFYVGGDMIVMVMRREDCRWLDIVKPEKMRIAA